MTVFVATYRKVTPRPRDYARTQTVAQNNRLLARFLELYERADTLLDWGDDPSFLAATEICGDVRSASWGVCRRDLREQLLQGDLVVFFCAVRESARTHYHFVGFGTVKDVISRADVWTKREYACYREFLNILARPQGTDWTQCEYIFPWHPNWQARLPNYVLFEPEVGATEFRIVNAPRVASYVDAVPETWLETSIAKRLEEVLFVNRGIPRRLRTSTTGYAHRHLRITADRSATTAIRAELAQIVASMACQLSA